MKPKKKSLTSKLQEAAGNPENSTPLLPKSDHNPSRMPLSQIKNRDSDTRPLNQKHIEALALSIEAIGLIEPLVVDAEGVLLAGGHRKAAIILLQQNAPDAYLRLFSEGIPVRRMEFSASIEPDQALAVEIAENEQRRDYTRDEIKGIAERLKAAGFEELKGRPAKGQKPLMPALSAVVGKSIRQLRRVVNEDEWSHKSGTQDLLSESDKYLKRAIASLETWQQAHGNNHRETNLAKELPDILERLKKGTNTEST